MQKMQLKITEESLLIILCVDLNIWEKKPELYWKNTTDDYREGWCLKSLMLIFEAVSKYKGMKLCATLRIKT